MRTHTYTHTRARVLLSQQHVHTDKHCRNQQNHIPKKNTSLSLLLTCISSYLRSAYAAQVDVSDNLSEQPSTSMGLVRSAGVGESKRDVFLAPVMHIWTHARLSHHSCGRLADILVTQRHQACFSSGMTHQRSELFHARTHNTICRTLQLDMRPFMEPFNSQSEQEKKGALTLWNHLKRLLCGGWMG